MVSIVLCGNVCPYEQSEHLTFIGNGCGGGLMLKAFSEWIKHTQANVISDWASVNKQ